MNRRLLILFLFWTAWHRPLNSFSQQVPELLSFYFTEVRSGKYPAIPKQITIAENALVTLENVRPYLTDTSATVRAKGYGIVQLAGTNARQSSIRESATILLTEGCKDNDPGNAGIAIEYLTSFIKSDFTSSVKDSLRNQFKRRPPHFNTLIKLVGFLDLKDLSGDIRALTTIDNPSNIRWAAILSLARMGDATARQDLMRRVSKLPVNDEVVHHVFPDLLYTRTRDGLQYMIEILRSDNKTCLSADAEQETPILCGYRVMEQLAPAIMGYPLDLDESGDIKSSDYLASLASVRYWFLKNKDYEILRDRF
jgi:hypothetical protein